MEIRRPCGFSFFRCPNQRLQCPSGSPRASVCAAPVGCVGLHALEHARLQSTRSGELVNPLVDSPDDLRGLCTKKDERGSGRLFWRMLRRYPWQRVRYSAD